MIKNSKFFILVCFFSLLTVFVNAQEAQEQEETAQEETEESAVVELTPEQQRIEMEIKVSTISELAALCRILGLPESGSREELSKRLRDHYGLSEFVETNETNEDQKVITIESAETSEYFKIAAVDEEYARLRGNVRLSMKDGSATHIITAQEILFNRTRNIMTASGGVVYEKTDEGTVETFRGSSITVNIDDWSSVFLGGMSERNQSGDDTVYQFTGRVISRSEDETTVLRNGSISSGAGGESYWSISASRIWLLPGQDFALLNAVLKVGNIPLLYLPVFFYPVDEMIFHPVFGYRPREGAFVQSTTYIMGRPSAEKEPNSITRILGGSSDMDTERHGIFLRSTGKKTVNLNETSLRLLVDYYANMGTYAALEFSLPKTKILSDALIFNIGFGFTRSVTPIGGLRYSPYPPDYDGAFDWNHSSFFSKPVPFRYNLHFASGIDFKAGQITWNIPYYSDPFTESDFLKNRSESIDWFNITQDTIDTTQLSAPEWTVNINNLAVPVTALSPYVSRFTIPTFASSLTFASLTDSQVTNPESPSRMFFAPNTYTIYNISANIGGVPLSLGQIKRPDNGNASEDDENPLAEFGELISPWANEEVKTKTNDDDILSPPVLSQNFSLPGMGNVLLNIDYNIRPTSSSVMQFITGSWPSAEDVNWRDYQSILTSASGIADINLSMNHSQGLFANKFSLQGDGRWKDFTYINEDAPIYSTPDLILAARKEQYRHTRYTASYEYNGTVRPLLGDPVFGQSSFQYNFKGTLVNSKKYDDKDSPELTPVWGSWAKPDTGNEIYGLEKHLFISTIQANLFDKVQNLTLSLDLPPRDIMISANAAFRVWITDTSISARIRQDPDNREWIYDPVNITETIRFKNNSFGLTIIIDPEENKGITSIISSLSFPDIGFNANFWARRTQRSYFHHQLNPDQSLYNPANQGKWTNYGDPVLQPEKINLSYRKPFQISKLFGNYFFSSITIGTSLTYDLIEHTRSIFTFSVSSETKITNLFDIELSASSDNSVIFRYFKRMPGMEHLTYMYKDGRQNNVFLDLVDSFNFFDNNARYRSGFKMGEFKIVMTHFLGDWQAVLDIRMYPHLFPGQRAADPSKFKVTTDFSFLVKWTPITEFKADIKYEGQQDKWSLN